MTRTTFRTLIGGGSLVALALLMTGCQSLTNNGKASGKRSTGSWFRPQPTYESPEQLMVVWTDAVQNIPGQPPRRGCGGRLYFFDRKSRPIPVDGTLIVYAFDDAVPSSDGARPQARFVFSADQFTKSFSESELGASYNVWVPWDTLGNPQKKLTLITVFRDGAGKVIKADPASVVLPGKVILTERQKRGFYEPDPVPGTQQPVTPVSYEASAVNAAQRKLNTTTIRVPRSLSQRMASLPPTAALDLEARRERYKKMAPWSVELATPPGASGQRRNGSGPAPSSTQSPSTSPASVQPPANALGYRGFTAGSPQQTTSARATAWSRYDPRSAHFARSQSPAQASPAVPPTASGDPTQPAPAGPQWRLPSLPGRSTR